MPLMVHKSLYDVLLVDQNATLDEIKSAFKRRALQVHPDKGGSKDAFHLVYEALEILADPVARKKYDISLKALGTKVTKAPWNKAKAAKSDVRQPRPTKTTSPCGHSTNASSKAKEAPGRSARDESSFSGASQQTKLLMKIYELLKRLPRDLRNEVISKHFSQQQRLILEKFIVDTKTTPCPDGALPAVTEKPCVAAGDGSRDTLVLAPQPKGKKQTKIAKAKSVKRAKKRNGLGNIKKDKSSNTYLARIFFDSLEVESKYGDLQSALDYLVILTSIKQKMRQSESSDADFKERLQEALVSSAQDHGKDHADLKLTFSVAISVGVFSETRTVLRSPRVHSLDILSQLHSILDPFRVYSRRGNVCMFQHLSPAELETAWGNFQAAIAKAWRIVQVDSTSVLQRFQALHLSSVAKRQRHLQLWERRHMASEDKNRHKPKAWRTVTMEHLERRERGQMAKEDGSQHQPDTMRKKSPRFRLARWERQQMAMHDKKKVRKCCSSDDTSGIVAKLRMLLVRWGNVLAKEARFMAQKRRKFLAQRKKEQQVRKQTEALNRKRCREEERLKRESIRKRMKDDTMNDIPWL